MDLPLNDKKNALYSKLANARGGSLNADIKTVYKFQEILGGGSFGTVRVAYKIDCPQKKYAIKSISKKHMDKRDMIILLNEVQILSNLDHPNIIKLIETYQDDNYFHIVTELCIGKDVFTYCNKENNYDEDRIKIVIFKLLSAIYYLNNNAIVHRDIKTMNLLFDSTASDAEIKLIDFGLSLKFKTDQKLHKQTGTPYYVSPEVIKGDYDVKCDIWSIGVLAYFLLSGEYPFMIKEPKNIKELYEKIQNQPVSFNNTPLRASSRKAKDFLTKSLTKDPKERIDVINALDHPWFKSIIKEREKTTLLSKEVLFNIRNCNNHIYFKKLVLKFLINFVDIQELKPLKEQFSLINTNRNGTISVYELHLAYKKSNIEMTIEDIEKLLFEYGGELSYSEFISASLDQKKLIDKIKLIEAFKYFDVDNNGFIDSKDLNCALLRIGKQVKDEKDIISIIEEVSTKSGANDLKKITLEDFFALFNF